MMRYLPVGLLILTSGALAYGQQAVPLRLNLATGQSWKFTSDQTTDSKNDVSSNGQSQTIQTLTKMHRGGTVTVVAVQNGVPSSMRVVFDKDCSNTQEANGQQQKVDYPYAGATVILTRGANGEVTDDFTGQADADSQADMHGLLDIDNVVMPGKAVSVGDEWSGNAGIVGRVLQLTGQDRGGMTLKLMSMKMIDSRPVAEVKMSFAVLKNAGPINGKIVTQGTVLVDLATGHTIKTDLKGTVDLSGQQQSPDGQTYDLKGSGTMTVAGGAPLETAPAHVAAPMRVPAPAFGGGNPLDDDKLAPFIGTFGDGKLKVDLSRSGDMLGGTITLNGNSYPARATLKDGGLSGTFTAGGQSYPFSAALQGDTLTLVSGSKTYELKKAGTNPLDSGPGNPLSPR